MIFANIDTLIRLAWLEGMVNTHGAYERAVLQRKGTFAVAPSGQVQLIERLERAVQERKPLTVGSLLRSVRSSSKLLPQDVFTRIGVSRNVYTLIEQDAISPLKIPAAVWERLMGLLKIALPDMAMLLRRTVQLTTYRPRFAGMLARYKGAKGGKKLTALEKAFAELYARADIELPQQHEQALQKLLEELRRSSGTSYDDFL